MIHWMRERLGNDERGFTLIELMVVVLIIAILIAIAIPTFLGARERAQDRAAQSGLRNALTAEKVYYTDNEAYTADGTSLQAIEPSLTWSNAASTGPNDIYTRTESGNDDVVCLEALSESGTVFFIGDVASGTSAGTYYLTGTQGTCDATTVAGGSTTGW